MTIIILWISSQLLLSFIISDNWKLLFRMYIVNSLSYKRKQLLKFIMYCKYNHTWVTFFGVDCNQQNKQETSLFCNHFQKYNMTSATFYNITVDLKVKLVWDMCLRPRHDWDTISSKLRGDKGQRYSSLETNIKTKTYILDTQKN